jgi:hypothetical protein
MATMDKSFDGSAAHLLTKQGKPDMRRKEFATPEQTAKRAALAKRAGYAKLAKKAAKKSQADYAERLFSPAMLLLAKIEATMNGGKFSSDISSEVTKICDAYYGDVRPCL